MSNYCFPMPLPEHPLTSVTPTYALLKDYSVVAISGADARSFLQGQVTCDVEAITPTRGAIGAQCNLKGRVETAFVAIANGADLLLVLPTSLAPHLMADLNKYAMFSQVSVNLQDDYHVWASNTLPSSVHTALETQPNVIVTEVPQLGYMGVIATAQLADLQHHCAQDGLAETDACRWEADALAQGFCLIGAEASAQWTPHELNYDLIEAVNFKKGCYRGQEIVARVHYRGQTKVRGYGLKAECSGETAAGVEVIDQNGVAIGKIVKSVICDNQTWFFSALNSERLATAAAPLRIGQQNGVEAQQCPLGYAIP